jgi:hypothetical protein
VEKVHGEVQFGVTFNYESRPNIHYHSDIVNGQENQESGAWSLEKCEKPMALNNTLFLPDSTRVSLCQNMKVSPENEYNKES